MKTLSKLFLLAALLLSALPSKAAVPSFGQFDLNYFTTNGLVVSLRTNNTSQTFYFVTNLISLLATNAGSPGGADTEVQWNNAGVFDGSAQMFWLQGNQELRLGPSSGAATIIIAAAGNISAGSGNISLEADGDATITGTMTAFSLIGTDNLSIGGGDFVVGNTGETTLNGGNLSVHFAGAIYGNGAGITNILFSGSGAPAITPAAANAQYVDTVTDIVYHWYGAAWH